MRSRPRGGPDISALVSGLGAFSLWFSALSRGDPPVRGVHSPVSAGSFGASCLGRRLSLVRGASLACGRPFRNESYLVDPASSHMLVSKIKPCMSKFTLSHGETANGSLNHT